MNKNRSSLAILKMLLLVRNSEDYTDEEPADLSFPSFLPAAAGPKQQPNTHNAPVDVVLAGQLAGSSAHLHRHQRRLEALRLVEAEVASAHRHRGGASDRPGRGGHLTESGGREGPGFRDFRVRHNHTTRHRLLLHARIVSNDGSCCTEHALFWNVHPAFCIWP